MLFTHILLAFLWVLYCVTHSALASRQFKTMMEKVMRGRYRFFRLYYNIVAVVWLGVLLVYLYLLPSYELFVPSTWSRILGSVITLAGLILMTICIIKYFFQLSGIRKQERQKETAKLMVSGIHKRVRHPLYTGTFLFVWGLGIVFPTISALIVDTIITVYTLIGIQFEEKKLESEFGSDYILYKKNVPMLLPRLTPRSRHFT